jgi:hypothetical protein
MKFTGSGDMIFGHSDYGHYTMELNRGTWALTLQLKGTPSGSDQELGSFPTLAKAQAYALKTDKMLAKLDKQSGFGSTKGLKLYRIRRIGKGTDSNPYRYATQHFNARGEYVYEIVEAWTEAEAKRLTEKQGFVLEEE